MPLSLYSLCHLTAVYRNVTNLFNSAAYAANGDWKAAANDGQECVKDVDPSFFKGYYRLAKAQLERKEFAATLTTINSGLDDGTMERTIGDRRN